MYLKKNYLNLIKEERIEIQKNEEIEAIKYIL